MVHSLTLNYMDKVSQLIFFAKGGGKGGGGLGWLGWSAAVAYV